MLSMRLSPGQGEYYVLMAKRLPNILVVDVGGTNVKLVDSSHADPIKIPSGASMTARRRATAVKKATTGSKYAGVSIGYPGPVLRGKILAEPYNLAEGWIKFDFARAFGCPVR